MSVQIDDFVKLIEKIAPPELAEDWDNTGLLIRNRNEINRVLIALEVTDKVINEALGKRCDMILSHHPIMFEPVRNIDCRNVADVVLMRLIKEEISLYAAHTSFDRVDGGINDILAKKLKLKNIKTVDSFSDGIMRTGQLEKAMGKERLLEKVKQLLEVEMLKVSATAVDEIKEIAVVGGSGGNYVEAAKKADADALITGEAKHHNFIEAEALGVLLIEAGHFNTERYFTEEIFKSLQSSMDEVQLTLELIRAESGREPYKFF